MPEKHPRRATPQSHPGQVDIGLPKTAVREPHRSLDESPLESGGTAWSDSRPKERPGLESHASHEANTPVESATSSVLLGETDDDAHDEATHDSASPVEIAPDERGEADPRRDD